jgi:hypothetical protein
MYDVRNAMVFVHCRESTASPMDLNADFAGMLFLQSCTTLRHLRPTCFVHMFLAHRAPQPI